LECYHTLDICGMPLLVTFPGPKYLVTCCMASREHVVRGLCIWTGEGWAQGRGTRGRWRVSDSPLSSTTHATGGMAPSLTCQLVDPLASTTHATGGMAPSLTCQLVDPLASSILTSMLLINLSLARSPRLVSLSGTQWAVLRAWSCGRDGLAIWC